MSDPDFQFDQVVFSGGGIRCFWHGGFMSRIGNCREMAPERISGVSGGALSGAAWIGDKEDDLRELMCQAFDHNDHNYDLSSTNYTPHQELYRAVVATTLDDEAIGRICEGPDFQIILGLPPQWLPPRLVALYAGLGYQAEQQVRSSPHLNWPRRLGMRALRVDAKQAARQGKLIDLVCAAATIPPVFDVPCWDDQDVLDGGMLDKAPLPEPDRGRTLILLTRVYRNLPQTDRHLYVQPSAEVAADKIDFTDRTKVERTWEQGRRDVATLLELGWPANRVLEQEGGGY